MKLTPEEKKVICDFFELLLTKLASQPEEPKPDPKPEKPQNRLIPVTKWNEYHQWPTVPGLRHLIYYRGVNGFSSCVRRAGRRLLIDERAFFEWLEKSKEPRKN